MRYVGQRQIEIAFFPVKLAAKNEVAIEARPQIDRDRYVLERVVEFAEFAPCDRPRPKGVGVFWVELERAIEIGHGKLQLPRFGLHHPASQIGRTGIGIVQDGFVSRGKRFGGVAEEYVDAAPRRQQPRMLLVSGEEVFGRDQVCQCSVVLLAQHVPAATVLQSQNLVGNRKSGGFVIARAGRGPFAGVRRRHARHARVHRVGAANRNCGNGQKHDQIDQTESCSHQRINPSGKPRSEIYVLTLCFYDVKLALAVPAGLEPATRGVEIRYSIQLSYGTVRRPDRFKAFIALPI